MYIRVKRVVYPLRVPRVIRVFIDLLLSVYHLKGMGVYLSLLCHAGVWWQLRQLVFIGLVGPEKPVSLKPVSLLGTLSPPWLAGGGGGGLCLFSE